MDIAVFGLSAHQDWLNFYMAFGGQPLTLICEKSVDYVDTFHEMLVPYYSDRNRYFHLCTKNCLLRTRKRRQPQNEL